MNYRYHIYTPFSRWHNLPVLLKMLAQNEVIWHPIYEKPIFPENLYPAWVKPVTCPCPPPDWEPANWKANWFLEHAGIDDGARYLQFSDDDWYDPSFFKLVDAVPGNVLIATMLNNPGPGSVLTACRANLKENHVGGQQIIVQGSIARHCRYGRHYAGDWTFIAAVTRNHPPAYVPNALVYWNQLPR